MAEASAQKLVSEFTGTALLLATVVGSGIMAENLAGGNVAVALLGNTIPTGAILYVLITMFGPVSGAHFNPAVTFAFWLRKEIATAPAFVYVLVQIAGAIAGVLLANAMFDLPVLQISEKLRSSPGQWLSEVVATFGLVLAIFMALRARPEAVATVVGLYITAAYWFTASTSFANPAVTIARQFSNTFAGIAPSGVALFIAAQMAGAVMAVLLDRFLADSRR
ncbi:MAG: aquaporin family protein [Phyllobacteriaceae bacterium]|nr:aquaporin family protein [Nitratireductor sp.]MCO5133364.1 aquaporin family protein [Phyllobacteriaceae bacterium]